MLAQNLGLLIGAVFAGVVGAALVSAIDKTFGRRHGRYHRTSA